jgi:hypothetical protein
LVGEFKDDCLQNHEHYVSPYLLYNPSSGWTGPGIGIGNTSTSPHDNIIIGDATNGRVGTTTHGKQKAVKFLIKVL